ncbi:MAG TPA: enoyl-CoA hydratase-related protein [Actinomycetota bacterium]
MSDTIIYDVSDGIATITLNRPDSLNALNTELSNAFIKAIGDAGSDLGVRAVIITGAGRAFCAGADLAEVQNQMEGGKQMRPDEILRTRYNPIVLGITEMPKPVIAAVNGAAAGAGSSVALACDIRIAGDKAKFLQAFIKIGLIPDSGAHWLLPRLVGQAKATELAITGETIDAEEALRIGMVNRVVPQAELLEQATAWAKRFATGPTVAYGLTKKAFRLAATADLSTVLDIEADLQAEAALTRDSVEGVVAFIEKRDATFEGR